MSNFLHLFSRESVRRIAYPLAFLFITGIAGCGEANGSSAPAALKPRTAAPMDAAASVPSAPIPANVLPMPMQISSGSIVKLQCGKTYQGTLDLKRKSNITVLTVGNCGKAGITPGRAVSGWKKYRQNIYSAPITFKPVQVSVDGKPVEAAHWPNRPRIWAESGSDIPDDDLNGATLVYLENQSVVATKPISGNRVDTSRPFYVEGKLWMLDRPGEWAVSDGRLYLWAPDGQSPEGRVWAAPDSNGIDADHSTDITIDNVRIFSAADGISGDMSTDLKVLNSKIVNSARNGIWASGSRGLTVDETTVANSVRSGIDGGYSVVGAVITNSTVINSGTVGRHKPTDAGIMFGDGKNNRIDKVRVVNSGYHGISVLHNWHTSVTNSVIDTACVRLTDCGGIYTGARDQLPLNLRIEGNTVTNIMGHEGIAIYLDDSANRVTVSGNTISSSTIGMVLHNGFDNLVSNNTFSSNAVTHIKFVQDTGRIRNNHVSRNTFRSTNGEQTFNLERGANLRTFAIIDHNTYISSNTGVFGRSWDGNSDGVTYSYSAWKNWMGQDAFSTMNGNRDEKNPKKLRRIAAD